MSSSLNEQPATPFAACVSDALTVGLRQVQPRGLAGGKVRDVTCSLNSADARTAGAASALSVSKAETVARSCFRGLGCMDYQKPVLGRVTSAAVSVIIGNNTYFWGRSVRPSNLKDHCGF